MQNDSLDVLFIEPNSSLASYQGLAKDYAAIETPTWSLLLAQSCRAKGFKVGILDSNSERLTPEQVANRVVEYNPRFVCYVVYGQTPNSGTTNMSGAVEEARRIKLLSPETIISIVGSYPSALPKETLLYGCFDIVLLNEGVYALHNLLATKFSDINSVGRVKGIGYNFGGGPVLNEPERLVPTERMDIDLPGYAWDLLPYRVKPFDLYRAHFWHTNYSTTDRTPFAAIYTSLGCQFKCDFCMINILNRTKNGDEYSAANFSGMRFWSPEFIFQEFKKLKEVYGVSNIRISDEMFFLNKKYYVPLLNKIVDADLGLNMWAYSRVDTCKEDQLALFKKAGINWLALGIEAANQTIRREITKGAFEDVDIRAVTKSIQNAGIGVVGNFIFGLPNETLANLQESLDLCFELLPEFANFYCAAALPGSPLYNIAIKEGWDLPKTFAGYSFNSYECLPLPTKHLKAKEVLEFRDEAWMSYNTDKRFLDLVERKFGGKAANNILDQSKVKLKRRLLEV